MPDLRKSLLFEYLRLDSELKFLRGTVGFLVAFIIILIILLVLVFNLSDLNLTDFLPIPPVEETIEESEVYEIRL